MPTEHIPTDRITECHSRQTDYRDSYALNNVGSRAARTETGGAAPRVDVYGYDAIDQVTQVKYGFDSVNATAQRQTDFAYDLAGNRSTVTEDADGTGGGSAVITPYVANSVNQYTTIDGETE